METRLSIVSAFALVVIVMNPAPCAAGLQTGPEQATPQNHSATRESGGQRGRTFFWKDPAVIKEVGLSPEQIKQIDLLWQERLKEMSARAKDLRQQEADLHRMITGRSVNADVLALQIDRVESQRTILYKSRTLMLYRMALVLTPEQNKSLEAMWMRLFFDSNDGRGDSRGGR